MISRNSYGLANCIRNPLLSYSLKMASWKPRSCSCCVLLIQYILHNKFVLDCVWYHRLSLIDSHNTPTSNRIYCHRLVVQWVTLVVISRSEHALCHGSRDCFLSSARPLFIQSAGLMCHLWLVQISCPLIGQNKLVRIAGPGLEKGREWTCLSVALGPEKFRKWLVWEAGCECVSVCVCPHL